ncbi:uncharacterized protein LOC129765368 isoform X1 [Toxorhynchites rutilus septentrionalis]|uniref:uncharacterized protein LOC129765368 isoform X1 n=1 Tax=Toxorhynchites rutilus septentrionalis TaxID=329112 RepID=UPI002479A216|nr:uncharacterized protein LOC129765368 isoform X1 [Toxorhynchites rutilus septentrionalis]
MASYGTSSPAASMFKSPPTALQLLLEEINFQRTKEMRQLLKDDGGFVVLQGTTYWTDLFVRHFLFQTEKQHSIDCDDLLFFVRKKHVKGSSRVMPKYETEIEVFRKDSRKLPIGDPDVDWEETVYLNLVIHQFDYMLTLAICTRTSPKELQVLRRHTQKVYASPSRRKMDTKGESEEITYPHICFMVDNFDEVFHDILVRDGEMVCVELVATDRDGSVQGVIFLGSIRYDALKKVYDARQSSLSSKVAQRMSFGLFSSGGPQTRCEFVRMKGPQGKGHAEMAVTKPKGSGVETPTSEPGFCATDMWDSEWEDDCDEYYNYRHQRRLSDPSANLNNFSRYGWRSKNTTDTSYGGTKARSENEGLDCLANEVSEIEAGDLRDDRPASSASDSKLTEHQVATHGRLGMAAGAASGLITRRKTGSSSGSSSSCCNCFGPRKRWSDTASTQMSDVYYMPCPKCEAEALELNNSPACLGTVSKGRSALKHRNLLIVESEIEYGNGKKKPEGRSEVRDTAKKSPKKAKGSLSPCCKKKTENNNKHERHHQDSTEEVELADDAVSLNGDLSDEVAKMGVMNDFDANQVIRVNGKEEFPVRERVDTGTNAIAAQKISTKVEKTVTAEKVIAGEQNEENDKKKITFVQATLSDCGRFSIIYRRRSKHFRNKRLSMESNTECQANNEKPNSGNSTNNSSNSIDTNKDFNGNNGTKSSEQERSEERKSCPEQDEQDSANIADALKNLRAKKSCSTLPKVKKPSYNSFYLRPQNFSSRMVEQVPKRRTPDGTDIYYWCDYHPKKGKELDDGAYNPLWTTKGFTQTFHFWKENRRQQSIPLNAFLTYVTLPWWSIAKDLLDHREQPILTF